jgi:hypothetical protein
MRCSQAVCLLHYLAQAAKDMHLLILNTRSAVKFNLVRRKINVKRSCERLKTLNEYQRLLLFAFGCMVYRERLGIHDFGARLLKKTHSKISVSESKHIIVCLGC